MAKATKRKVIRARGNNLKKTVRRGRKLNRAVNHLKVTKKRRKSRSRRTSRKVRNNLNLNQSGGLAGSISELGELFKKIFEYEYTKLPKNYIYVVCSEIRGLLKKKKLFC